MTEVAWVAIIVAVVICATRVVAIVVALHNVESKNRAAVLRALAECFRWWRRRP